MMMGILATWRLTRLLYAGSPTELAEDGPFDVFARLRDAVGVRYDEYSRPTGANVVAKGLSCFWCTSVWAGLFVARGNVIKALAYSAGAILIQEIRK